MTELPTLRNALREDAARHYGRRRRPWRVTVPVFAVALAALVFAVVALEFGASEPRDEVAATPTPAPTVAFTATPAPNQTPPPVPPRHKNGPLELAAALPVAPGAPALKGLLGGSPEIVRAWYVRKLKGHVILSRRAETPSPGNGAEPQLHERLMRGRVWCLSAPDPLTDEPDIERGSTCGPSQEIQLGIGSTTVVFVPEGTMPPELTNSDGTKEPLRPTEGLVVILSRPDGSRLDLRP